MAQDPWRREGVGGGVATQSARGDAGGVDLEACEGVPTASNWRRELMATRCRASALSHAKEGQVEGPEGGAGTQQVNFALV
uniref:Uncharacterized protein n=1 Tax=Oryza glumipatula TaxID=40148 RepID=A0A0E0AZY5_9ORYZ